MAMTETNDEQHPNEDQGAKDTRWQGWIEIVTTVIMAIRAGQHHDKHN
jgi:hypothetical protein